jgi:hypothetical protein
MPALNITFTREELALIRERARTEGTTMTALVHDFAVTRTTKDEEDDLIMAAYAQLKVQCGELLRRLADK